MRRTSIVIAAIATIVGLGLTGGIAAATPGAGASGHVHLGRNEGTTTLDITVTYLDVPVGGGVRIDAADPGNCGF
ncbi:MAG: hypothetical protein ACRDTM_06995 [Micromonosporaceae bacterium]